MTRGIQSTKTGFDLFFVKKRMSSEWGARFAGINSFTKSQKKKKIIRFHWEKRNNLFILHEYFVSIEKVSDSENREMKDYSPVANGATQSENYRFLQLQSVSLPRWHEVAIQQTAIDSKAYVLPRTLPFSSHGLKGWRKLPTSSSKRGWSEIHNLRRGKDLPWIIGDINMGHFAGERRWGD